MEERKHRVCESTEEAGQSQGRGGERASRKPPGGEGISNCWLDTEQAGSRSQAREQHELIRECRRKPEPFVC